MKKQKSRVIEIDNLFMHIYEDNISGKITDDRFRNLPFNNEKINSDIVGVTPELDKIKEFHKLNPKLKLRVNCVINKKGIDSFDKMEEFALKMKELGFTSVKFSEMSTDDPNDPNFIDLQELLKPYCNDVHQNDTLQSGCYLEPKSLEKKIWNKNNFKFNMQFKDSN